MISDVLVDVILSYLGDIYYTAVLEDLEVEGQDFKADSWSMAVDTSYLQTHRKNIIKRQDVIYGDIYFFFLRTNFMFCWKYSSWKFYMYIDGIYHSKT